MLPKCLLIAALGASSTCSAAVTMLEDFEYATEAEFLAYWIPTGGATPTLSADVAPGAAGDACMKVEFNFASIAWATEIITGPSLFPPRFDYVSIAPEQYVTFRLRGDPAFAVSDFSNLYLYVYDANGDFARWGVQMPLSEDWQIINLAGDGYQFPWDASGTIDMASIEKIAFVQYGSQAAIDPYTATIHVDEVQIRDEPLTEFPPPSEPRALIDDFEGYADDEALRSFYSYENSWHPTVTVASLETPAPQGNQALKLAIDFATGQYPWGSVRSPILEPFSIPADAVVTLSFKGDPALAERADAGTVFWLSFYDAAGNAMNYITDAAPVISSDWTTLEATVDDFGGSGTIDIGNLVQWRILVEGWEADQPALSGAFYVDDIRVSRPVNPQPMLSAILDGARVRLEMTLLTPGAHYDLESSDDFDEWTVVATIAADTDTATWLVDADGEMAYFRLVEKP